MNFDVGYNIHLLIRTHRPKDNLAISPVYSWSPIISSQLLIFPGYCEHIIWSSYCQWARMVISPDQRLSPQELHLHEESTSVRLIFHHVAHNHSMFSRWKLLIFSLIFLGYTSIFILPRISPRSSRTTLNSPTI